MTVSAEDNPGVIAQPPRIFMAALALGAALAGAGIWLVSTAMRQQRAAGTNIETHRPTETIVSNGLYRFSRNPIYIGLFGIYLGCAVLGDSVWVLALALPLLAVMY